MEKRSAVTFNNKRFSYTGSITSNLKIFCLHDNGVETGTVLSIDGDTISYIKDLIRKKEKIKMGACRDNPSPNSLGRYLKDRNKTPQILSYVLPLLEQEKFLERYKEGNAFLVKFTQNKESDPQPIYRQDSEPRLQEDVDDCVDVGTESHEFAYVNDLHQQIQAYYGKIIAGEHHRYRSWEHCNSYFRRTAPGGLSADRHQAALQLAFYLASWGMYRGAGFLLQYAYTVHLGVIDILRDSRFSVLWETDFGSNQTDRQLVSTILDVIDGIRAAYRPFAQVADSRQPTDTLITKVIMGTFGCLPACDRYFIGGFKSAGFTYSYLNRKFIECVLRFCQDNLSHLREEQERIERIGGVHYPLMKLVDMYFFQIGSIKDKVDG